MSVDQLLNIIDATNIKDVSATQNYWKRTIQFDSVADIKQNKARLAGNPTLYMDGVQLEFIHASAKLSVWAREKPNKEELLSALYSELVAHKSSIDKIIDFCTYLFIPAAVVLIFSTYSQESLAKYLKMDARTIGILLVVPCAAVVMISCSRVLRKGITYTPVPGFWSRHGSSIAASILGTLILGWLGIIWKIVMSGPKS
ncbi:hypothetical protein NKI25_16630 [Mesorhizobium sp. M0808]|uniref:hypothetical protein n=1 Tax=Mesorhizobium sp. M0808 TaxID=2957002 RepID=UPI00333D8204